MNEQDALFAAAAAAAYRTGDLVNRLASDVLLVQGSVTSGVAQVMTVATSRMLLRISCLTSSCARFEVVGGFSAWVSGSAQTHYITLRCCEL